MLRYLEIETQFPDFENVQHDLEIAQTLIHTCQPWYLYMQDNATHIAGFCRAILHDSAPSGEFRHSEVNQIFTPS